MSAKAFYSFHCLQVGFSISKKFVGVWLTEIKLILAEPTEPNSLIFVVENDQLDQGGALWPMRMCRRCQLGDIP